METTLQLKNHVIVCGLGSTAFHILEELDAQHQRRSQSSNGLDSLAARDYVIIDKSQERLEKLTQTLKDAHTVVGDATEDEVLEQANIKEAYGIFPVLTNDKDNVYISLTARQMNPSIRIVARTTDLFNIGQKLYKAGANSVISPNFIGGLRLVSELARPHVTEFLDEMLRDKNPDMQISEIRIGEGSELNDKRLLGADIPGRTGLVIIAMLKGGMEHYLYNPPASTSIEAGDTLVVLGGAKNVLELQKLA